MTNGGGGGSAAVVVSPGERGDSDKMVKVTLPDNQVINYYNSHLLFIYLNLPHVCLLNMFSNERTRPMGMPCSMFVVGWFSSLTAASASFP